MMKRGMDGDWRKRKNTNSVREPFKLMFHFPEERLCFYGALSFARTTGLPAH
jgi:hypothetical protein